MKFSPIAIFAAGFIAGSVLLGGVFAAHARTLTRVNLSIAGVPPNSEGGLLCVTAANVLRPIKGTVIENSVNAPGGKAGGVWLRCPP